MIDVNTGLVKEFLLGKSNNLLSAFIFAHAPKGHDYWFGIHSGKTKIQSDDIEWLQSLIK